jgi:hypothetical protein
MTDEKLARAVSSWLEDTDTPTPDLNRSVRHAMAHVERTRQLGRWWSPPSFRRTQASRPTSDQTSDYQPTHNPATNARTHHGHTPTVLGRTHTMLSPVKAITAGAIVFAIGGAFLIAQPFQQQSSVPGAEADFAPPVEVTGTSASPWGCTETDYEGSFEDNGVDARLFSCSTETGMPWSFTDPRLEGVVTRTNEESYIDLGDGSEMYIAQSAISIENDGGTWHERPRQWLLRDFDFLPDEVIMLDGDGEYEGLVAVLRATGPNGALSDFHGYIIDERMYPPAPENASTQ